MATKTEYELSEPRKALVESEEVLKEMKQNGQLIPFTDYYTPDEDAIKGNLLINQPYSSGVTHTINTELTEGTYDILITGNASAGTDMYFYVNNDTSATYFWNAFQTYHASSSVTGGGKAWTNSFYMGSMFIYESRYHITLTITRESGVMFNSVGGGIDQSIYYARHVVGSKASVPDYKITSISFSSFGTVTTAGNIKIYKRY